MTKRNEQTGKKVASKAAALMTKIDDAQEAIADAMFALDVISNILEEAHSVAASALTQSPDKPKRRK